MNYLEQVFGLQDRRIVVPRAGGLNEGLFEGALGCLGVTARVSATPFLSAAELAELSRDDPLLRAERILAAQPALKDEPVLQTMVEEVKAGL